MSKFTETMIKKHGSREKWIEPDQSGYKKIGKQKDARKKQDIKKGEK